MPFYNLQGIKEMFVESVTAPHAVPIPYGTMSIFIKDLKMIL